LRFNTRHLQKQFLTYPNNNVTLLGNIIFVKLRKGARVVESVYSKIGGMTEL